MQQFMHAMENANNGFGDFSFASTMLAMLLAFVLGQVIAWAYTGPTADSRIRGPFTQSLVLMTLVIALVMFVIGDSLVTAFGLLGALAMIRFRNVLKDTRTRCLSSSRW